MIGLGSNRLTVCRRGGMSVTQAGRGGMEWLAGGRVPSWASPYSDQATAALKDAFPAAQWQTIRDYGFAHPEIVGYMNAYAPEDAKIAYSLVEGIGTRWIVGDGTAYIDTGVVTNAPLRVISLQKGSTTKFGSVDQRGGSDRTYFAVNHWGMIMGGLYGDGYTYSFTNNLTKVDLTLGGALYIDDVYKKTFGSPTVSVTKSMPLFAIRNNDDNIYANSAGELAKLEVIKEGSDRNFLPFRLGKARTADQVYPSSKGAQAVGTLGMLDLVTGLFHPNANSSGSFSESIDPSLLTPTHKQPQSIYLSTLKCTLSAP